MANTKEEFYFDSCSGGKIRACRWIPDSEPVAVFQIIHGIAEHVDRYDDFAAFLNGRGVLVVAEDHMGHGKSAHFGTPGYFEGGWFAAVDDCYHLLEMTMQQYPDLPYILFGHSMGSFLARSILIRYPNSGIKAAIICGTGWQPKSVLSAGISACKMICKLGDEKKPNASLERLVFGSYNQRVEHPRTPVDWLTRDNRVVDQYILDPMCGFAASAGLLRDMLCGMNYNESRANLQKMNRYLPVLFIAGGDDPVGSYGDGIRRTVKAFTDCGMQQVDFRIFPLCRHEILNEINRVDIYEYILSWISKIPMMI